MSARSSASASTCSWSGSGFRTDHFKANVRSAAAVSIAGMVVPFVLGRRDHALAHDSARACSPRRRRASDATLFMGAAMAITAFPMLARIIHERGLTGTSLGTLALAAGAIDDAAAWCVLAVVLATFGGGAGVASRPSSAAIALRRVHDLRRCPAARPSARWAEREPALGKSQQHDLRGRADAVHAVRLDHRRHRPARGVRRLPPRLRHAARHVRRRACASSSSRSR